MPAVAVVGGSLGGLTTALLLRDIGCDVTVYERSRETLQARGAGIAVLPETLRYPVERLGVPVGRITSSTEWIRFIGREIDKRDPHAWFAQLPVPVRKRLTDNEVYEYVEIMP